MSDRRVPPGGGIVIGLALGLLMWACITVLAKAQDTTSTKREFLVVVDTAGIAPVAPYVYTTWVYALSSPTSLPSSGILVEWDCSRVKVRRVAQVKYQWNADSTGVEGPIEQVDRPWQEVSDQRMYNLVCAIGPIHEKLWSDEDAPPSFDDPRLNEPKDKPWDGKSSDA
jgi:hypothetical protein